MIFFDRDSDINIKVRYILGSKKFLNKIESLVNPGGIVVLSTPDKYGVFGETDFNEQHINIFSEEELKEFVGKDRVIDFSRDGELLQIAYKC